jgi:hypothetical protein
MPSPPTYIRSSTPGPEGPSAGRCQTTGRVPSSRFRTALTACSLRMLRACCIPLPDGGFAAFPAAPRADPKTGPWSRVSRDAVHTPRRTPLVSSRAASPRPLPSCRHRPLRLALPFSSCADHRGDRSLPTPRRGPRVATGMVRRRWANPPRRRNCGVQPPSTEVDDDECAGGRSEPPCGGSSRNRHPSPG